MSPVFMTVQHSRVGAGRCVILQAAALELHSPTSRSGVSDVAASQQFDSGESVAIFCYSSFRLEGSQVLEFGVWGVWGFKRWALAMERWMHGIALRTKALQ